MKTFRSKYLLLFVLPVIFFVSCCRTKTEKKTHLKTIKNGEPQDVLTENNQLPIEKINELMTKQNVNYVALELNAFKDKQQCIENHKISIQFLKVNGILN